MFPLRLCFQGVPCREEQHGKQSGRLTEETTGSRGERGGDQDDNDNNASVRCSLGATRLDILFMPKPGVREQDSGIAGGLGVRK